MYSDFSDSLLTAKKGVQNNLDISSSICLVNGGIPRVRGIMLERLSVAKSLELHLRRLALCTRLAE